MRRYFFAAMIFSLVMAPVQALLAAEVAGVKLADSIRVGDAELALNGAGLRTRMMLKIYVGALYLTEKKGNAVEILDAKGPKRVAMHLLRSLSAEQFTGALVDGLNDNLVEEERARFAAQIDELKVTMAAIGSAKEGSVVTLDLVPGRGTRLTVDGAPKGKLIPDEDFYRALLKIWLGDKPADKSLKAAMLGQG